MAVQDISTSHKDLIRDVAFDFYGQRMATCGLDHTVNVFDQAADGSWATTASFKVRR
jgi:nucleoporin SEH1